MVEKRGLGRPRTDLDPYVIVQIRDGCDRLTWTEVLKEIVIRTGYSISLSVARKLYAAAKDSGTGPSVGAPVLWSAGRHGGPPLQVLNRNLKGGRKYCGGPCHMYKEPAAFSADRATTTGVYLHGLCRRCVKLEKEWAIRVSRRLLGLDKTPEELKEAAAANRVEHERPGRPPTIDIAVAWDLHISKGWSRVKLAAHLGVSLSGLNSAMDGPIKVKDMLG